VFLTVQERFRYLGYHTDAAAVKTKSNDVYVGLANSVRVIVLAAF
jgi:hypothetical protein